MLGGQAVALTLSDCDRVTHPSHGGETAHANLGEGRVMWLDWWSQEGTGEWITVVDCAPGTALRAQSRAENLGNPLPFDRTDKALAVIERHERGARAFATLGPMNSQSRYWSAMSCTYSKYR